DLCSLVFTLLPYTTLFRSVRKWHFQMVHHGIWDHDVPCASILCDIPVNGRMVKAIAQPTKQAYLYVLNRETGEPIWPIEEKAVPDRKSTRLNSSHQIISYA